MANIILFTDRAPRNYTFNQVGIGLEYYNRPAGAYVLASWLRKHGYSVLVVPHSIKLTLNGVKDFISRNDKDLLWVGISTTFFTVRYGNLDKYRSAWHTSPEMFCSQKDLFDNNKSQWPKGTELAWSNGELNAIGDFLNKKYPEVPLIVGGAWITELKNGNLQNLRTNIYTIPGNAELYVKKVSEDLKNKKGISVELVSNVEFDNKDFITNSIDYTDHDFVDPTEWLGVEVSRACAFNCAYCTYDRKSTTDNYKVEALRDELIRNYEIHGVKQFALLDDLYNDDPDKVKILYDKVWSKLPFKAEWVSYLRLDLFWSFPETAEYVKASGCRLGAFGIETLNDKAGKKVGKGLGKKRLLETLEMLKQVWGDEVIRTAFFISGLPYEPKESIEETVEWMQKTDLIHTYDVTPHWITPPDHKLFVNRLSPISKDYDKYGITWNEQGWVNNVGVTWTDAQELAYRAMSAKPNGFSLGLGPYPDIRAMGFSHQQAINLNRDPNFESIMKERLIEQGNKIDQRLKNIFNITGQ
jgi:radical SAM superfamily enzyme YgiQ (UPF0313 family)